MTLRDLIGPSAQPAPAIAGYWQRVAPDGWSMGGNDRVGDCTYVTLENQDDLVTSVNGNPEVMMEAEAERFYTVERGFQPGDKATDVGEVLSKVIDYWATQGWPGDPAFKAKGWCALDPSEIHQAIHSLGCAPAWCMLPQGDDDWDFSDLSLRRNTPGTGAHAVLLVESGPTMLRLVTWARVVPVSLAWWRTYGRDAYGVAHPAWRVPAA